MSHHWKFEGIRVQSLCYCWNIKITDFIYTFPKKKIMHSYFLFVCLFPWCMFSVFIFTHIFLRESCNISTSYILPLELFSSYLDYVSTFLPFVLSPSMPSKSLICLFVCLFFCHATKKNLEDIRTLLFFPFTALLVYLFIWYVSHFFLNHYFFFLSFFSNMQCT